ncbi:MAG: hypothetical protein IJZ30_00320 [Alphaproteobacteria bacterium]|nr:hypothetical protein [Alphaproteobacteria bacterium]
MLKFLSITLLSLIISVKTSIADIPLELQELDSLADLLPENEFDLSNNTTKTKLRTQEKAIIPQITEAIPEAASFNINNPEQVFCYHVEKRPSGYKGYTLGNYAIKDYCGELDFDQTTTVYEALFTRSPNIITTHSNCRIEPKVMLRFLRGVDYTDVLLSSPCHSFTIFYAGRYKSFNVKQGIIDDIISQFSKKTETFHSPALIKQTMANAVAKDEMQSYELEKNQKKSPSLWNNDEPKEQSDNKPTNTPTKKGWGKIKLNM